MAGADADSTTSTPRSDAAEHLDADIRHRLGHFVGDEPPPEELLTAATQGAAIGMALRRLRRVEPGAFGPMGLDWFWRREHRVVMIVALGLALVLLGAAAIAAARLFTGAPSDTTATSAQAGATGGQAVPPTGTRWYFTNTAGLGLYTILLEGDGTSGAIDVIEDATDTGTFTWEGQTLTIDFTRELTMRDGYVITDPWRFECTGTRVSTRMACATTVQQWSYSARDGFVVEGEDTWPSVAVPR